MSPLAQVQVRLSGVVSRIEELQRLNAAPRLDRLALGGRSATGVAFDTVLGGVLQTGGSSDHGSGLAVENRVDGGPEHGSAYRPAARPDGGPDGGDVVAAARAYLGVPYLWGGTDPARGLDCSGLVQRVFADLGIDVPRVVDDQEEIGTAVASLADARPGDLLAFRSRVSPSGRHIGIYLGDGQMIHAPRSGRNVEITEVDRTPSAIRRVVPAESPPAPVVAGTEPAGVRPAWARGASASPYDQLFAAATARYGLPANLLSAVARAESGYRADAVSPAGAVGLMQIMPGTAADLGVDPRDPTQAVDGAARYLRQQLDRFGEVPLALAAYNAGPGAVSLHGGIPPYAETRTYVSRVMGYLGTRGSA